jgi:hypothetical protein
MEQGVARSVHTLEPDGAEAEVGPPGGVEHDSLTVNLCGQRLAPPLND